MTRDTGTPIPTGLPTTPPKRTDVWWQQDKPQTRHGADHTTHANHPDREVSKSKGWTS